MTDSGSGEVARHGSEEEAAWRDLIGRLTAPDPAGAPVPWPEIESVDSPVPPGVIWVARPGVRPPAGTGTAAPAGSRPQGGGAEPDEDEHFVPPPPPPLPSLTPVAKGAWVALFGGPAYLLAATMAGWSVPGWAAFGAVAAFIAGFVILVIRVGDDDPPRETGSGDGAVV